MTEKPILFKGEMVRRIQSGDKTQTRRIVKCDEKSIFTPKLREAGFVACSDPALFRRDYPVKGVPRLHIPIRHPNEPLADWDDCACETLHPPWQVGDRLWVKETFYPSGNDSPTFCGFYRDTDPDRKVKWKPAIYMPRSASRITLEITDVRVQRVQEISAEDAKAEGVTPLSDSKGHSCPGCYTHAFQRLWDSISGNWKENPWVWAITFRKLE